MSAARMSIVAIWGALFASALGSQRLQLDEQRAGLVNAPHDAERDRLEIEWSQLKIEQSAWATHGRVEQTARTGLNMVIPTPQEVQLVQP
jgi:cell division protein FtsL